MFNTQPRALFIRLFAVLFLLTISTVACGKSDAPKAENAKSEAAPKDDAKSKKKADKKADKKKAETKKDDAKKDDKKADKADATAKKDTPSGPAKADDGNTYAWKPARLNYEKGQWVKYSMKEQGKPEMFFEYKILDTRKDDEVQFEVVMDNPKMKFAQQMWMKIDFDDPTNFKVLTVRMKMGKAPARDLPAAMVKKVEDQARGMFGRFFGNEDINKMLAETLDPGSDKLATVTTPAGTFKDCRKVNTKLEVMGQKINNNEMRHTAVPITLLVQSDSADGKTTMKLVEFGLKGAKASF